MGTSSAMNTSNQYIKYTITITQNSQDTANNKSNVTVSVRFYRTNTGYTSYGTGTVYCKINGTTYSAGVTPSQKITNSGIVLFTKTLNISHNSDGTKTLTCSAWIEHDVVTSSEQSYSQALTTIPRASTLTVANGTLGTAQTITAVRNASSFTHTLIWECGSYSGTIGSAKTSSTSWSFTPAKDLANGAPNSTKVYCKFTLKTYSGSTLIGSDIKSVWMTIPSDVTPTRNIALSEPSGQTHVSTYGGYIQGQSQLKVTISASGKYSSTIKSYSTTVNGATYTTNTFTTSVLKNSGTNTVSCIVTDSRGRKGETPSSTSSMESFQVIPYTAPKISKLSVKRCNSDGTDNDQGTSVKVTISYTIKNFDKSEYTANAIDAYLKYKKTSDSEYNSIHLTTDSRFNTYNVTNQSVIIDNIADNSSYDIKLDIADSFTSASKSTSVSTGFTIMHFNVSGKGIGIGKLSEDNTFDIGMDTKFKHAPKIGGVTLDYILEQGTFEAHCAEVIDYREDTERENAKNSITMRYRKWNSGILECWAKYEQGISISQQAGSFYRSNVIRIYYSTSSTTATPPFTFIAVPNVTVSGGCIGLSKIDFTKPLRGSSTYAELCIISLETSSYNLTSPRFNIRVIGRWK